MEPASSHPSGPKLRPPALFKYLPPSWLVFLQVVTLGSDVLVRCSCCFWINLRRKCLDMLFQTISLWSSVLCNPVSSPMSSCELLQAKLWPESEDSRELTSPVQVDPRPDEPVLKHQVRLSLLIQGCTQPFLLQFYKVCRSLNQEKVDFCKKIAHLFE